MNKQSESNTPPKRSGLLARRIILGCILFLVLGLAATQVFLHQTHVESQRFVRMTFLLYTGTAVVVLAILILAAVLGRNLVKLYFERKSGQVGSGFKTKMVRTFIVLSLFPAVLLFLLAYGLISSSIEQWFQAPQTEMVDNSRLLAQRYYDEAEQRSKYFAASIAGYVQSMDALYGGRKSRLILKLLEFCHQYDIDNIRVFDENAEPVAEAGNKVADKSHRDSMVRLVRQTLEGRQSFQVERVTPMDPFNEISWATASIRDTKGKIIGVVLTETLNPQSMRFRADSVMRAYLRFQELQEEKSTLRYNILLILALSTLLVVFAFSWFALYLAKRITVPIQALAEGAAEVAGGNLEYRVRCQAFDELASLVSSFNRMTGDLQENERRIEAAQQSLRQTNVELDNRRRYIETILETITTGVISIDAEHRIRTLNRAAIQMLQIEKAPEGAAIDAVIQAPACDTLRGLLVKSGVLGTVVNNIHLAFPGKSLQLATAVTPLDDSEGRRAGWVVVLDDMTELVRMEKLSAWQEVARRLAHEIKNPLTPIQLSAERLLNRCKQMGPPPESTAGPWKTEFSKFDRLLEECTRTIIKEAGSLKSLVDEFSRFARLPEIRLEMADLHAVLDRTLGLYDGRIRDVRVQKEYDTGIPRFMLDPEAMKRVFINLFDNALEAMAENSNVKLLQLHTSLNPQRKSVRIEIGDSGRGFPEAYQDSLFLPYFSARKGGTGLGLAIVRQIVSDHHGDVYAEQNHPEGTKIIIDLPLASA